jgi:hypothetical protein
VSTQPGGVQGEEAAVSFTFLPSKTMKKMRTSCDLLIPQPYNKLSLPPINNLSSLLLLLRLLKRQQPLPQPILVLVIVVYDRDEPSGVVEGFEERSRGRLGGVEEGPFGPEGEGFFLFFEAEEKEGEGQ